MDENTSQNKFKALCIMTPDTSPTLLVGKTEILLLIVPEEILYGLQGK